MTTKNRTTKAKPEAFIQMRGALKFRFPAHASLEVRRQVIARFVSKAQALIDQEQELERLLAAVRGGRRGSVASIQRTAFTYAEAAEQMGITVKQLEREVSIGLVLAGVVGYVPHISDSEIRRYNAERTHEAA